MKDHRNELIKHEQFDEFLEMIKSNKYVIENFCNYANTALNIKDKAKIIMHIKEDLSRIGRNLITISSF